MPRPTMHRMNAIPFPSEGTDVLFRNKNNVIYSGTFVNGTFLTIDDRNKTSEFHPSDITDWVYAAAAFTFIDAECS